ncbi:MAG TPA: hypothetical protein VGY94_00530 [Acidobacteriaceae bacterium]|jgi:hypothetical protein|nr:hypothetical protein [Acidobacteriaceae bacterium]
MALRLKHITSMVLVGDGLLALINPEREALAWRMGPEPFRSLMGYMAKRPTLTRWVGAAQIGLGIWWALRDEPKTTPRRA